MVLPLAQAVEVVIAERAVEGIAGKDVRFEVEVCGRLKVIVHLGETHQVHITYPTCNLLRLNARV